VWRHLLARGRAYDVVHTAAFPYFPLLAAGALRRARGYRIIVDWFEVWTRDYWRAYAGATGGTVGWLVQRACVRVPQRATCASQLHARRLLAEGYDGDVTILPGLYAGPIRLQARDDVDPELVVYAGRHVKEKRVPALVRGFAEALRSRPDLRLELFGDGPERTAVETLVAELGLSSSVRVNGRRPEAEVADAMARAACLATASEREGYGLVVVEAAAHATPSVVVAGPENAATELVEDGVNGAVSPSPAPADLARSLLSVVEAGRTLRESTGRWFEENAARLTLDRSLQVVVAEYQGVRAENAFQPHAV
jgi:glycosyltransferase involved in cell wall biosynthesis